MKMFSKPQNTKLQILFRYMLLAILVLPFLNAQSKAARFSNEQIRAVNQISQYLGSIRTLEGMFTQIGPRGRVSTGKFIIAKPGRMRFEYAPPNPFVVVSDGTWVAVKNKSRKRVDHYPLSSTPLRLILARNINFFKDANVKSVKQHDGLTTITLNDLSKFVSGSLILVFDSRQHQLQQWIVIDDRGRRTSVSINNVKTGGKFNPAIFRVKTPENRRQQERDKYRN